MADQTQNYAFSLPMVDGSEDLWGDLLNQNWSDLDALLKAREDEAGTLTGRVTTAEGDLNSLDDRVTTAEGDLNSLDDRVTTAEGDIDDLDGRVSSAAKLSGGADANFATMPQVGGAPIVESGSNSDGEWTRWADGTQQCFLAKTISITTAVTGSIHRDSNQPSLEFPLPFSTTPKVIFTCMGVLVWAGIRGALSDSTAAPQIYSSVSLSSAGSNLYGIVSGRWK